MTLLILAAQLNAIAYAVNTVYVDNSDVQLATAGSGYLYAGDAAAAVATSVLAIAEQTGWTVLIKAMKAAFTPLHYHGPSNVAAPKTTAALQAAVTQMNADLAAS